MGVLTQCEAFHKWGYPQMDGLFHGHVHFNGRFGGTPIVGNPHLRTRHPRLRISSTCHSRFQKRTNAPRVCRRNADGRTSVPMTGELPDQPRDPWTVEKDPWSTEIPRTQPTSFTPPLGLEGWTPGNSQLGLPKVYKF